jgi:hypothetical protein
MKAVSVKKEVQLMSFQELQRTIPTIFNNEKIVRSLQLRSVPDAL